MLFQDEEAVALEAEEVVVVASVAEEEGVDLVVRRD